MKLLPRTLEMFSHRIVRWSVAFGEENKKIIACIVFDRESVLCEIGVLTNIHSGLYRIKLKPGLKIIQKVQQEEVYIRFL